MTFDMTINLGNIIALIGFLIAVITWGSNLKWEIRTLEDRTRDGNENVEKRLAAMESKIDKFTEIYIATRMIEVRLSNFDHTLDELKTRLADVEGRPPRGVKLSANSDR